MFPIYSYICIISRDKVIHYYNLTMTRLLVFFDTESIIALKTMRKNLKSRIIAIIEKLGPELYGDELKVQMIKRRKASISLEQRSNRSDNSKGSYQAQLELNSAFASLAELENL